MRKKNQQYYKSKRRVLKYKNPTEATINAMRIATQAMLSAIQVAIALQTPRPKPNSEFPKGGMIVGEQGKEMVCGDKIFGPRTRVALLDTPDKRKFANDLFDKKIYGKAGKK